MPDYTSGLNLSLVRESLLLMVGEELPTLALKEFATLAMLPKKTAYQTQIKDNVNVGGRVAQRRLVTDDRLRTGSADTVAPFQLNIGDYAVTSTIQVLKTQAVQAANTAPGALADLFRFQVQGALRVMMRDLNSLIFTGTGLAPTSGVVGLQTIVAAVSYAGITDALWSSLDLDVTAALFSAETLRDVERQIAEKEAFYDMIIMSPRSVQRYKAEFDEKRTFQVINGSNPADLGISTVSYNGRPIIQDNQCPTDEIYFVDSSALSFHTYSTGSGQLIEGLNIDIQPVPVLNQYLLEFEVGVIPQLCAINRKGINRLIIGA